MTLETIIEQRDYSVVSESYCETPTSRQIEWPAPWLTECVMRIHQLQDLKANWDSYNAFAVNEYSVHRTIQIVQQLARITDAAPTVNPTPTGNLSLNWSSGNDQLELDIEIRSDGLYEISYCDLNDESQDRQFVIKEFARAIELIPRA